MQGKPLLDQAQQKIEAYHKQKLELLQKTYFIGPSKSPIKTLNPFKRKLRQNESDKSNEQQQLKQVKNQKDQLTFVKKPPPQELQLDIIQSLNNFIQNQKTNQNKLNGENLELQQFIKSSFSTAVSSCEKNIYKRKIIINSKQDNSNSQQNQTQIFSDIMEQPKQLPSIFKAYSKKALSETRKPVKKSSPQVKFKVFNQSEVPKKLQVYVIPSQEFQRNNYFGKKQEIQKIEAQKIDIKSKQFQINRQCVQLQRCKSLQKSYKPKIESNQKSYKFTKNQRKMSIENLIDLSDDNIPQQTDLNIDPLLCLESPKFQYLTPNNSAKHIGKSIFLGENYDDILIQQSSKQINNTQKNLFDYDQKIKQSTLNFINNEFLQQDLQDNNFAFTFSIPQIN